MRHSRVTSRHYLTKETGFLTSMGNKYIIN